jgi:hypothetical protein
VRHRIDDREAAFSLPAGERLADGPCGAELNEYIAATN